MVSKKKRLQHVKNRAIKQLFKNLRRSSNSFSSLNNLNDKTSESLKSSPNLSNKSLETSNCDDSVIIVSETKLKRKHSEDITIGGKKIQSAQKTVYLSDDEVSPAKISKTSFMTPGKSNSKQTMLSSTPIGSKTTLIDLDMSNVLYVTNNNDSAKNLNSDIDNLTKEIIHGDFVTIDLTTETKNNDSTKVDFINLMCSDDSSFDNHSGVVIKESVSKTDKSPKNKAKKKNSMKTSEVIDLENSADCTFTSISNASLSSSNDSQVTIINLKENNNKKRKNENKNMKKIADGIAQLNSSQKGKLLDMITRNIFNGCAVPSNVNSKTSMRFAVETENRATETAEDSYIKEVILGQKLSRNSIGSNIYNPEKDHKKTGLRMIVIDGSNVAMEHGKGQFFSVKGLKICIEYFLKRGHIVKAFVPRFRCKYNKSSEPRLLDSLERQGLVVYTPSREIQGRFIASYDDRYIVQCAAEFEGVIVSGDNYRDLLAENPSWRTVIETRLLPFTWVGDMIMFPRDPLGRNGPTLEQFLKHP